MDCWFNATQGSKFIKMKSIAIKAAGSAVLHTAINYLYNFALPQAVRWGKVNQ